MWVTGASQPLHSVHTAFTDHYPFAIDECFDVYRLLVESSGSIIGMSGRSLNVIMSGDSACVLQVF